ncbi:DUF185-domain-containing protein [Fistulina hepatica ATCC 64428]|uniref:Protein arginine methyltransferase NDUFAF7 n=1 Tax=Fistulina hepatica ATCC 64428 TaxID=1128425 RepID=A0A0D6ZZ50_9AGAR|nr:DUF185-domain-containing protein [Fistulina hepatica ATCC 64428]
MATFAVTVSYLLDFDDQARHSASSTLYRTVTANQLENETQPPRRVKMIARDFIEDSLYNPHYGYFPKHVSIFNTKGPFDFHFISSIPEFQGLMARRYVEQTGKQPEHGLQRQVWHTPAELFQPWYGQAVARCIVSDYMLKYFPYEDFVIYEIGGGNGTLALNILDFLREGYPDAYERTRYNIIEISGNLATTQQRRLLREHPCVEVHHKSIFQWTKRDSAPCYFLATEVVDNFGHDIVRYDLRTLEPYQGWITIDHEGDFDMVYTPVTDPLIRDLLRVRAQLGHPIPVSRAMRLSPLVRELYQSLPLAANMSRAEYIPTRLLSFLRTLRNYFPRHRLLLTDFFKLPDTLPNAVNAPVVQMRWNNQTIPATTLLVKHGYFDIFFPTNFERLQETYEHTLWHPPAPSYSSSDRALPFPMLQSSLYPTRSTPLTGTTKSLTLGPDYFSSASRTRRHPEDGVVSVSGLPVGDLKSSVFTHSEFLETYADVSKTRLRNGENPMTEWYENVKFLF